MVINHTQQPKISSSTHIHVLQMKVNYGVGPKLDHIYESLVPPGKLGLKSSIFMSGPQI